MKSQKISFSLLFILICTQHLFPQTDIKTIAEKAALPLLTGKNPLKGVVIGIVIADKRRVFSYGNLSNNREIKPDDMLFDVASVTKNFTALLLAQSVSEGLIKYDDTAASIDGKDITWQQLAAHTSGLPNMPADVDHSTEYRTADLEKFIKECHLASEPGKKFNYSTAGYSLLGKLIAQKRGYESYDDCLRNDILKPLGFNSSFFDPAKVKLECYTGNAQTLKIKKTDYVFNPSGGLISGPEDLLSLISINLKPETHPGFTNAIKMTQQVIEDVTTFPGSVAALGWHYFKGMKLYWNSGVSNQSRCVIMFDPVRNCGIVIMTNSQMNSSDSRLEITGFGLISQLRQIK